MLYLVETKITPINTIVVVDEQPKPKYDAFEEGYKRWIQEKTNKVVLNPTQIIFVF